MSRIGVSILALFLVLATFGQTEPLRAQTSAGATLTVLRGTAAVLKADGTPISPASSGIVVGAGDQVSSLARSSALMTFFDGSELELGADTTLIVQELASQGGRTTITIQSVLGATIHRVVTLTDPGSSYRVEAGGSVALVRGTIFGHYFDPATGDVTVAVADSEVDFPSPGAIIRRGERRTYTSRGDTRTDTFDPSTPLYNIVTNPITSSNPSGGNNPGLTVGNQVVAEQPNRGSAGDDGESKQPSPVTLGFFLTTSVAPGATRLDVTSTDGLTVGDAIVVNPGQPNAETTTVLGFGSILVPPLRFGHAAGEPFVKVPQPPPSPTSTSTPTGTPPTVPTPTPTSTGTQTSTPTSTPPPGGPAAMQVNSTADTDSRDSLLTLREAILVASGALPFASLSPGERAQVTGGTGGPAHADTIAFAPAITAITIGAALPTLTGGSDTIDGGDHVTIQGASGFDCLTVSSIGNVIRGLTIRGCAIGVNVVAGTGNIIGGLTPQARNLISANTTAGIRLASNANTVHGNLIGTNAAGTAADANGVGILVESATNTLGGLSGTTPGGPCTGACNLISGNTGHGVVLAGANATANDLLGSFVGTNLQGNGALPNGQSGVHISGASGNSIGGTSASGRNVLSGNGARGVLIDGAGATGNIVQGNFVGTNAAGSGALGNGASGVRIDSANNTVGGTTGVTANGPCTGACNVVSGNGIYGVRFSGTASTGNTVQGNFIGTNVLGTAAIANAQGGVLLDGAPSNTIGGTTASGAGNLISANAINGVLVDAAASSQILGNRIGTNAAGNAALANQVDGVLVRDSASVVVGNVTGRNVISGNTQSGVVLSGAATTNARVQSNFIGVGANGTSAVPNNNGIRVAQAPNVLIGGTTAGAGNAVLANTVDGIAMTNGTVGAQIFGNEIGRSGLGNGQDGVDSNATAAGNHQIGGVNAGEENQIRFNGAWGVTIAGPANTGNTIRGNSIEGNVAGGIQTAIGVNPPTLTDPTGGGPSHALTVTVSSAGTIDVYLADSSASGQGVTYLVSQVAGGPGVFNINLGTAVTSGDVVVATLTDVNNNTSAFSNIANVP